VDILSIMKWIAVGIVLLTVAGALFGAVLAATNVLRVGSAALNTVSDTEESAPTFGDWRYIVNLVLSFGSGSLGNPALVAMGSAILALPTVWLALWLFKVVRGVTAG